MNRYHLMSCFKFRISLKLITFLFFYTVILQTAYSQLEYRIPIDADSVVLRRTALYEISLTITKNKVIAEHNGTTINLITGDVRMPVIHIDWTKMPKGPIDTDSIDSLDCDGLIKESMMEISLIFYNSRVLAKYNDETIDLTSYNKTITPISQSLLDCTARYINELFISKTKEILSDRKNKSKGFESNPPCLYTLSIYKDEIQTMEILNIIANEGEYRPSREFDEFYNSLAKLFTKLEDYFKAIYALKK